MVTRIVSNSGKRNGKPFRINAGADKFYGILQLRRRGGGLCSENEGRHRIHRRGRCCAGGENDRGEVSLSLDQGRHRFSIHSASDEESLTNTRLPEMAG